MNVIDIPVILCTQPPVAGRELRSEMDTIAIKQSAPEAAIES
jgi:hypothetical protein